MTSARPATRAELRLIAAQSVIEQLKAELADADRELREADAAVQAERRAEAERNAAAQAKAAKA